MNRFPFGLMRRSRTRLRIATLVALATLVTVVLWTNANEAGIGVDRSWTSAPVGSSFTRGASVATSTQAQQSPADGDTAGGGVPNGSPSPLDLLNRLLEPGTRSPAPSPRPTPTKSPAAPPSGFLLASSFERPVCGTYYTQHPGCEFGVQGDTTSGPYGARTGAWAVRIERASPEHMGVIADQPLPEGHAFVGVAQRVPAIPDGAIPADPGYIQLEQLSPTDGTVPGYTVEVRLYPDRTLGLALFRSKQVERTQWRVPVDRWFYLVVEVTNGVAAPQRLWVYDAADRLVDTIQASLATRQNWAHEKRTAQKIGGTVATTQPLYTYADDWYIARSNHGPLHLDADGRAI